MASVSALRQAMAEPTEPMGLGGIEVALDRHGNPTCPGCGCGGWTAAALGNSGLTRQCECPVTWDARIAPLTYLADAHELLVALADQLDRRAAGHRAACTCAACDALALLRRGVQ